MNFVMLGALVLTAIMTLSITQLVHRAMKPLDNAIENHRNGTARDTESVDLPWGLRPAYHRFAVLMDQLDASQANEQRTHRRCHSGE